MFAHFSPDFFPEGHPASGLYRPGPPLAADEELAMAVAARLRDNLCGTGNRVMVEVQNRVVILEGTVATAVLRSTFHCLVWQTPGVADVCNRLTTLPEPPGNP